MPAFLKTGLPNTGFIQIESSCLSQLAGQWGAVPNHFDPSSPPPPPLANLAMFGKSERSESFCTSTDFLRYMCNFAFWCCPLQIECWPFAQRCRDMLQEAQGRCSTRPVSPPPNVPVGHPKHAPWPYAPSGRGYLSLFRKQEPAGQV